MASFANSAATQGNVCQYHKSVLPKRKLPEIDPVGQLYMRRKKKKKINSNNHKKPKRKYKKK